MVCEACTCLFTLEDIGHDVCHFSSIMQEGLVDFQDGQDYTDRELILGAIAFELSNLCIDLNGYVRQVLGEI